MFWSKAVNSSEYEKLSKKITEIDAKVEAIATKHEVLKTDVANLRGRINVKLGGKQETEKPEEGEETIEDEEALLKEIAEAYGGQLPIELVEKYKNR